MCRELSRRERQVVWEGACGHDTKATAAKLGISPKTVDELWRRTYKKFDCRSRMEVISRLLAASLALLSSVLEREDALNQGAPKTSSTRRKDLTYETQRHS